MIIVCLHLQLINYKMTILYVTTQAITVLKNTTATND